MVEDLLVLLLTILVLTIIFLILSYVFRELYNYGIVGASEDPETGKPRLKTITTNQSFAIVLLLSLFTAPSCCTAYAGGSKAPEKDKDI